jgi:hypothetical protein
VSVTFVRLRDLQPVAKTWVRTVRGLQEDARDRPQGESTRRFRAGVGCWPQFLSTSVLQEHWLSLVFVSWPRSAGSGKETLRPFCGCFTTGAKCFTSRQNSTATLSCKCVRRFKQIVFGKKSQLVVGSCCHSPNPQWLSDALKAVISVQVNLEGGLLHHKDLVGFWPSPVYSAELRDVTLRLMYELELAFELQKGELSMIPCRLPTPDCEPPRKKSKVSHRDHKHS